MGEISRARPGSEVELIFQTASSVVAFLSVRFQWSGGITRNSMSKVPGADPLGACVPQELIQPFRLHKCHPGETGNPFGFIPVDPGCDAVQDNAIAIIHCWGAPDSCCRGPQNIILFAGQISLIGSAEAPVTLSFLAPVARMLVAARPGPICAHHILTGEDPSIGRYNVSGFHLLYVLSRVREDASLTAILKKTLSALNTKW